MKVILDKDNIVIAKGKDVEPVKNGIYIAETNTIYGDGGLRIIETPLDPTPLKHKIVEGTLVDNDNFLTEEEKIQAAIKAKITLPDLR
jgi:hypothetical protein